MRVKRICNYYGMASNFCKLHYEELLVCPCCGETSIFPACRCDLCGEWITGEYIKTLDGDRICGECYTRHDAGDY